MLAHGDGPENMLCMPNAELPRRPDQVRNSAEFMALLRHLKVRSGLTYRQLEEKAAREGLVLPRSTLADTLKRESLPRPETLTAFIHACGRGEEAGAWLRARERLADLRADETCDDGAPRADGMSRGAPGMDASSPAERKQTAPGWLRRSTPAALRVFFAFLALAILWPLGVGELLFGARDRGGAGKPPEVSKTEVLRDGWVHIRPARSRDLCVTEGRDRQRRHHSVIAVQRPCADAEPPQTYVEQVTDDRHYIQWHHPVHGKGCLTVLMTEKHVLRNMLEPWPTCQEGRRSQQFRFEPASARGASGYRVRVADTDLCLGISGGHTAPGAEVIQQTCTGEASQLFRIERRTEPAPWTTGSVSGPPRSQARPGTSTTTASHWSYPPRPGE